MICRTLLQICVGILMKLNFTVLFLFVPESIIGVIAIVAGTALCCWDKVE